MLALFAEQYHKNENMPKKQTERDALKAEIKKQLKDELSQEAPEQETETKKRSGLFRFCFLLFSCAIILPLVSMAYFYALSLSPENSNDPFLVDELLNDAAKNKTEEVKFYSKEEKLTNENFGEIKFSKTVNKSVGVVFTYYDTPLEDKVVNTYCDQNTHNSRSFYFASYWYGARAKDHNVNFNLKVACDTNQVQMPSQFLSTSADKPDQPCQGTTVRQPIKNYAQITSYFKKTNPNLKNYDYLAFVFYEKSDRKKCSIAPYETNSVFLMVNDFTYPLKNYFGETVKEMNLYYPAVDTDFLPGTFIHEIGHRLGATDKYDIYSETLKCTKDPATGKLYDGLDIMCKGVDGKAPALKDLVVSKPTAKEFGWVK